MELFGSFYQKKLDPMELLQMVDLKEKAKSFIGNLSGGQRQRFSIVASLVNDPEVVFLDEPTTGLHFADIDRLLKVLNLLVDQGNTVLIIEHNLDVIKSVDWVIDLGPEGGVTGGNLVAAGTPPQIAQVAKSYTGQYLKKII